MKPWLNPIRIVLIYLVVAGIWIAASDYALGRLQSAERFVWFQTYKGWLFVAVTGGLLFLLLRKAMASLQASEHRFRSALSEAPYPVALFKPNGEAVLVNRAWTDITGYTGGEMRNIADWTEQAFERRMGLQEWLDACEAEPVAVRTKSGTWRIWKCQSSALLNESEHGPLTVVMAVDITEQRHLESQLLQSQKMEAVGRLAGGIAHDFNNLLTIIGGRAELILHSMAAGAPGYESMREIADASSRAANLTRQLLVFSRRQVAEREVIDLNSVILSMESMLRRIIGEDVALTANTAESPCHVRVNPVQMEQVLLNLAVNARDAMPQGGAIEIRTAVVDSGQVRSQDAGPVSPGPYVCLSVADTGHGMPQDVLEHIFEPFFTTKKSGTGLGLATVYGVVKQNGGHIHARSTPGAGTEFCIYLQHLPMPEA